MSKNKEDKKEKIRPEVLEGAPLRYAPTNELGVVFLFAHLAKRWRIKVDTIKASFPDCIAYQKTQNGEKEIRIEFEYKSRNFKSHKHPADDCDMIVCWEHNWPDVPKKLEILELRKEYGLGFNVWIVPVSSIDKERFSKAKTAHKVSVPSQAHKDDLILYYFSKAHKLISDIFYVTKDPDYVDAEWKNGKDYMAPIKRLCELKSPIFYEDLKNHRIISTSSFVRANLQGRHEFSNVTFIS
jgi:hypothetical protein